MENVSKWRRAIRRNAGQCHVGDSFARVARHCVSRLMGEFQLFRAFSRGQRRTFIRAVIAEHKANRKLYRYVTRGAR